MSFLDLFMRNNKSEKVRFLSLFSGIGAFEKALDNIGVEYELVGFSEIDKYAVKSYCAIHGVDESMNLGDITKISEADLPKNIDLITYGFPCQDISLAGKQKGMFNEDGTQTRSGLFFEALRIIEAAKPRIAIAENVKNLTGKKFKEQFEIVLKSLEEAGYNNYWKVLNAKDFGIPQNRERVFIVSIRKDIDDGKFKFPEGFPLELRLKDMLEDEVDEKFYLSSSRIQALIEHKRRNAEKGNGFGARIVTGEDIASGLTTSPEKSSGQYLKVVSVGNVNPSGRGQNGSVVDADRLARAITIEKGEGQKILVCDEEIQQGSTAVIEEVKQIAKARRNCDIGVTMHANGDVRPYRLDKKKSGIAEMQINKDTNLSNTITAGHMPKVYGNSTNYRIRKLTPKECWRLMGFDDTDFVKAEAVNSNTQLYKQAGNSIVVDVLEALFINLKPYLK